MWFNKLPALIGAGDNKGKPNLIEITSGKMVDASGKKVQFGDATYVDAEGKTHVGIPAEKWEYPQFGPEPTPVKDKDGNLTGDFEELTEEQAQQAIQEFVKDSGGAIRAAENINDATKKAALGAGKTYVRTKESGEPAAIVTQGLAYSHDFSWAQAERVTNKSVREGAEQLIEEVDNLSKDEMAARLKALLGRK